MEILFSQLSPIDSTMPTKRKRQLIIPDNLGPLTADEERLPMVATGERLFRDRPAVYRRAVEGLAAGDSISGLVKRLKVSHNTLAVISRREKPLIEATRGHLQGLLGHASKLALERLIGKLDKDEIPPAVLPVCAGILVDKVRAGEGDAVTVIETRKTATLDDVKAELQRIKAGAVEAEAG